VTVLVLTSSCASSAFVDPPSIPASTECRFVVAGIGSAATLQRKKRSLEMRDGELRLRTFPPGRGPLNNKRRKQASARKTLVGAFGFIKASFRSFLWPGSLPDANFPEPIPPGSLGCPLFGSNIMVGSEKEGPEVFYSRTSEKLGHPRIWKFFFLGTSVASLSGGDNIRSVFGRYYERFAVMGPDRPRRKRRKTVLYGTETVMFERDPVRHQFLRRLVGAAMCPVACSEAALAIAEMADRKMDEILGLPIVKMEDVCEKFSLDIAWRQVLGLCLEESEVDTFHRAVKDYVSGIFSSIVMLKIPGRTLTAPYRGRRYLVSKIERRIEELESSGSCDGSTLSRMLFARDESNLSQKLTKEEVIENCLLLLVAGTETSASTLTMATFLLGLHPRVWEKLVREQQSVCSKHRHNITKDILDKECPYLEAVIKETMRIAPVSGGNPRRAKETFVVSGVQVPKGWGVFANIRLTHELDPQTRPLEGGKAHMDVVTGFYPERWLRNETRPSSDFLPFGFGPRYCLGASFAMAEMKIFLAVFAHRVERVSLTGSGSNGSPLRWNKKSMIPKPCDGVLVTLEAKKCPDLMTLYH